MNRRYVLLGAIALSTLSLGNAQASIVGSAYAHSRYFEALRDFNDNSPRSPSIVADYWQGWLQAQRAIKQNPRLAHKLRLHRCDLSNRWLHLDEDYKKLGLSEKQVQRQPSHIYVLRLAVFKSKGGWHYFSKRYWTRYSMSQRQIYQTVPKELRFALASEGSVKSDPLYTQHETIQGQQRLSVYYGLYGTVADANRDRKVLRRYLGLHSRILKRQLTARLIDKMWFGPR